MAIALAIKKIKICEFLLPPGFWVPPFGVAVHGHKPVGFWIGQWLQEHTADQAEHDRGRSGAKRQRQQRDRDKTGKLPKAAQCITHVLKEISGPTPSPHVP